MQPPSLTIYVNNIDGSPPLRNGKKQTAMKQADASAAIAKVGGKR